jgi:uncharacterized sporulation protein YeaH/YhbH (DUF444 family)
MNGPLYRIESDHGRFREIVRGRLREDLRRYLASGELIARVGEGAVSVPLPQIELPRFRFGDNQGGEGEGQGQAGEQGQGPAQGQGAGQGAAGDQAGSHVLEIEVDLGELADMLGEELGLPRIEPRGNKRLETLAGRWNGVRRSGPDSLRHFRRSYKNALKRALMSGSYDPENPRIVPERQDFRYRARREVHQPDSSAVVIHMMDVSGSMGKEQKEIVRAQAFWIDTWLRRQYKNLEVAYLVHDASARVVDGHTFFHLRESGGTKISSAYELCLELIRERYRPEDWNIYPFHYSDGDNWSARDTELCVTLLADELLPRVNQFCYSQVKSAHGSGQFKKDLDLAFATEDRLVSFGLEDKTHVPEAIRAFLGQGR